MKHAVEDISSMRTKRCAREQGKRFEKDPKKDLPRQELLSCLKSLWGNLPEIVHFKGFESYYCTKNISKANLIQHVGMTVAKELYHEKEEVKMGMYTAQALTVEGIVFYITLLCNIVL